MKKRKSYFVVLPKNRGVLFASWKIDMSEINEKISAEVEDDADLMIRIYSIENNKNTLIDSIPVHGLENNWHIFTKKEYFGKRIIIALNYERDGKSIEIIKSKEIDIPALEPANNLEKQNDRKNLYNLSRINLNESGENTSW